MKIDINFAGKRRIFENFILRKGTQGKKDKIPMCILICVSLFPIFHSFYLTWRIIGNQEITKEPLRVTC